MMACTLKTSAGEVERGRTLGLAGQPAWPIGGKCEARLGYIADSKQALATKRGESVSNKMLKIKQVINNLN